MKREKFSDSQIIRTGFYSCSEAYSGAFVFSETDARHRAGLFSRGDGGSAPLPALKKARVIRKSLRKVRARNSSNRKSRKN